MFQKFKANFLFKVIEINASARRSYKDIVESHIGATHSHRIDLQASKLGNILLSVTYQCDFFIKMFLLEKVIDKEIHSPPKGKKKPNDIRSFFGQGRQSSLNHVSSLPDKKSTDKKIVQLSKTSNAMSIILLDDVRNFLNNLIIFKKNLHSLFNDKG